MNIRLLGGPWPYRIKFGYSRVNRRWELNVFAKRRIDVETWEPSSKLGCDRTWDSKPARDTVARSVRQCLVWHMVHEVEESLSIDGVLLFSPHRYQSRLSNRLHREELVVVNGKRRKR